MEVQTYIQFKLINKQSPTQVVRFCGRSMLKFHGGFNGAKTGDIWVLKTGKIGKPNILPPTLHYFCQQAEKKIVEKCSLAPLLLESKRIYYFFQSLAAQRRFYSLT